MASSSVPPRSDLPDLLHLHLRRRAAEVPDAVALRHEGREVTFGELAAAMDRVAAGLRAEGVGAGGRVGLHLERSPEQVAAMLGALQLGAAVVPLPPSDPEGRLRRILAFGELDAVVDAEGARVDPSLGRILGVEALLGGEGAGGREEGRGAQGGRAAAEGPVAADGPAVGKAPSPDAPAFILSSSGSTGHPKMIVRSHRSFFHRLRWTWSRHPFAPGELGCQKAHMTTTHSLYELFEPLLAGAPTLLVPDAVARNLERFWETLEGEGVTRLLLVPSALRASLSIPGFTPPGGLRVVVLMGEYVPADLAVEATRAFPAETALYSIYGSTEASSTLLVDLRQAARPGEELPLGAPIAPEVEARVLDGELRPVPPGREGRLHLAGPPLFSGYWKDPEQTAAVLGEAPDGSGLLYDTRDRVRRTGDGQLHFVGRVDDVVKIRGFRVDLPEVERTLRDHPAVREAAVAVEGEGTAEAALVAFHAPETLDRDELFAHLRDRLPGYMVPSALVGVDDFPRTSSHKIDRRALLRDRQATPGEADEGLELDGTAGRVARVWEDVLGHRRFRPSSSFFEVGGTSLTAFSLVHRLREAFGLDRARLPEEALYRHPTLAGMADHLDAVEAGTEAPVSGPAPLLVTLRGAGGGGGGPAGDPAGGPATSPLFVVSSAGGTLGAYEKLAAALETDRPVVGIRDPFLWGERHPSEGFRSWLDRYEAAVVERQPEGPVHLCAYSSAGAFGWELARRLRARGRAVAVLALVDPLALDRGSARRFGHWALRATWEGRLFRTALRAAALLRGPALGILRAVGALPTDPPPDHALSPEAFDAIARESRESVGHLMTLSALLELNGGEPFALEREALEAAAPEDRLGVFLDRVAELSPEVEAETLERIVIQYEDQIRAQHAYQLRPLDVPVLLVEPESPHAGLLAAQIRPYAGTLEARRVALGPLGERERALVARFGGLQAHYRSMRDDRFVAGLARALEPWL